MSGKKPNITCPRCGGATETIRGMKPWCGSCERAVQEWEIEPEQAPTPEPAYKACPDCGEAEDRTVSLHDSGWFNCGRCGREYRVEPAAPVLDTTTNLVDPEVRIEAVRMAERARISKDVDAIDDVTICEPGGPTYVRKDSVMRAIRGGDDA